MLSQLSNILVIGGTSGLGEAFARALHSQGKSVIITGRRSDRLSKLASELPGLRTYQWDVSDINSISKHASEVFKTHPEIDTVFVNAGVQRSFFWADPGAHSDAEIAEETNTNFTAPLVIFRNVVPHLIAKANAGKASALWATTSGLAYTSVPLYPVYNATKAGLHQAMISLRQQVKFQPDAVKQNFNVVEIAPPYVETDLDNKHRERNIQIQGGPEKATKPMKLEDYMNVTMKQLASTGADGKMLKEIGTGFSEMGINAWRGAFDPIFNKIGLMD